VDRPFSSLAKHPDIPPLPRPGPSRLALVIGLVSASALAYEITLTRIFSLLFQYHFAYLAVSLAILGLSVGAALVTILGIDDAHRLPAVRHGLALLSLSFVGVAGLLATLPTTVSIALHVAVALVPFVLIGVCLALTFALGPKASGALYAGDLAGAVIGIAVVLGLLAALGAFNVVIALGAVASAALIVLDFVLPTRLSSATLGLVAATAAHREARGAAANIGRWCLGLSAAMLIVNLGTHVIDYSPLRISDAPADKTMLAVLHDLAQNARIVYTVWDPFARVDVVETSDTSQKFVFTDAGAGSYMLRLTDGLTQVNGLRGTLEYVPLATGPAGKTLILGAGAGKDIVLAELRGSPEVVAVEVNPSMVEVTRRFAAYNGHVFDRPDVRTVVGDARTFVEGSPERFDLVYLNLVYSQATPPAAQALAENYAFTREAFRAYLSHLSDDGRLAIIAHNGIEGTRAAITAIAALSDLGVPLPDTLDHLALLMKNASDPTQRPTIMILSKRPLAQDTIGQLGAVSKVLGLQPLHLPGVFELGFKGIKDGQSIDAFLSADKDSPYALAPVTDNNPFFFKLDRGIPAPVIQALVFASVLALFQLILLIGQAQRTSLVLVVYIACIGLGFMLIEVPLIQRFQLLIGYPVLALALVLAALLLGGGAGSWISQRWPVATLGRRVSVAGGLIVGIGLVYLLALPAVVALAVSLPFITRVVIVVLLTAPLGWAMGVPFPSALRFAGEQGVQHIGLLWGLNGAFSVLGSTLAMWLAMSAGFEVAFALGVAAYAALTGVAWHLRG